MKIWKDKTFPNKRTMSYLYESTLNNFDFDFDTNSIPWLDEIENIKIDEKKGKEIASWYEDIDGKLIVAGLTLKDPFIRIHITEDGFSKIPIASRRITIAKNNLVETPKDLQELFTPFSAIPDPLKFVGRHAEVSRIINEIPIQGKLFAISGERSLGKSSFLELVKHLFDDRKADIEKYYGAKHNAVLDSSFVILNVDASIGPKNIQGLAKKLYQELKNEFSDNYQTNKTIKLKFFGLADIILAETKTVTTENYVQLISEFTEYFQITNKKRIVLLIDELDHYSNPKELASLFRNISKNGVLICIAGSSVTINSLLSGHISLLRDTIQLNLRPLTKVEFQEIYFIANLMARKIIQFDNDAIEVMWEASGGLPYFAQLFGYLSTMKLLSKYGTPEDLIQMRKGRGPELIKKGILSANSF